MGLAGYVACVEKVVISYKILVEKYGKHNRWDYNIKKDDGKFTWAFVDHKYFSRPVASETTFLLHGGTYLYAYKLQDYRYQCKISVL